MRTNNQCNRYITEINKHHKTNVFCLRIQPRDVVLENTLSICVIGILQVTTTTKHKRCRSQMNIHTTQHRNKFMFGHVCFGVRVCCEIALILPFAPHLRCPPLTLILPHCIVCSNISLSDCLQDIVVVLGPE